MRKKAEPSQKEKDAKGGIKGVLTGIMLMKRLQDTILELWKLTPDKYPMYKDNYIAVCCILMHLRFKTYEFHPGCHS
jgi:hypothetical protein